MPFCRKEAPYTRAQNIPLELFHMSLRIPIKTSDDFVVLNDGMQSIFSSDFIKGNKRVSLYSRAKCSAKEFFNFCPFQSFLRNILLFSDEVFERLHSLYCSTCVTAEAEG